MSFHHVAIAVRDLAASDCFYRDAMGFELVHAEAGVTDAPAPGGWAKHVFYDTGGGGLLALWDLHDPRIQRGDLSISGGMGMPSWVNHLAFDAIDLDRLIARRDRLLSCGLDVLWIDHGWTEAIYTDDPDGNMVEWCASKVPFGADQAERARRIVADPAPELAPLPSAIEFFVAADHG